MAASDAAMLLTGLFARAAWPTLLGLIYGGLVFLGAQAFGMIDTLVGTLNLKTTPDKWSVFLAFMTSSILIGTFVQVFWDKDTVSRPI